MDESKEAAIFAMQTAITNYINSKIPKERNSAVFGVVDGDRVHLTDGRNLRYDSTIDALAVKGSTVACVVPDYKHSPLAVIVGVA